MDDEKLLDWARIEEEAEKKIIRRAEQIARIVKLCWVILVAIVLGVFAVAVAWTVLKIQVNQNTRAIKILWQDRYGVPLP